MSERFYLNLPLQAGPVLLEGAEARHLAAVCRLRPGDAVCLFNGDGREYPARVAAVERRHVELEVTDVLSPSRELPFHLEVAAPVPKGDRAQFLVEKLTELGVTSFVPLSTRRSVAHPRETRLDKLQRYVIESSKQCGRNVLMTVQSLTDWNSYCRDGSLRGLKLLAQPRERTQHACCTTADLRVDSTTFLAVGPEGGFAEEEIADAVAGGWKLIDLGPRILRVETAVLTLVALCAAIGCPAVE